jgi:hypothetical protein
MRESVEIYPRTAAERAMKLQEVLLGGEDQVVASGGDDWHQRAAVAHATLNVPVSQISPSFQTGQK